MASPPQASAVLVLVLSLSAAAAPALADDFCATLLSAFASCPAVPTIDTVDLVKYTGRWYGVGTNAQFAFGTFGQQGGQCVTANYTALGVVNGKNTVKVVNRALLTISSIRSSQSLSISQNAESVAFSLRAACHFLVSNQSLFSTPNSQKQAPPDTPPAILSLVKSLLTLPASITSTPCSAAFLAASIASLSASSSKLSAVAKAAIAVEVGKIGAAVDSASGAIGDIYGALEGIQTYNGIITGSTLPTPSSLSARLADIQQQVAAIKSLADQLSVSRYQIQLSAKAIRKAADWVDIQVVSAANKLENLAQPIGPLAVTTFSAKASADAIARVTNGIREESQKSNVLSITGSATQSTTNAGALTVSFFGFAPSTPNYNIIKLDGDAASGYDSAIVYTCTTMFNSFVLRNSMFLLSRTPTVTASKLAETYDFLAASGIYLGGDNPLLLVSEDSTLCQPVTSLP